MGVVPGQNGFLEIDEVVEAIENVTVSRGKGTRQLSEMFMELPDKETWKEYYDVSFKQVCIGDSFISFFKITGNS